jgi:BirA family biotin operon repressor/biotin-[acetyl-CoA-carboxylase] ligase
VSPDLSSTIAGWDVRRYATVTSTMDVAAELIADGPLAGPTVIVADHQTAGRGRADRTWRSTPGAALQMTAVMALPLPAQRLGPLPLLVGCVVADSLEALDSSLGLALKWPNDVLLAGRKVAGILVVSRSAGPVTTVHVGIGISILDPSGPDGGKTGLDHLVGPDGVEPVRERLLHGILDGLTRVSGELRSDGGAAGLVRWRRRAILLGERVMVVDAGREQTGILVGVDQSGALRLQTDDGSTITVVAGDLTRGPRLLPHDGLTEI